MKLIISIDTEADNQWKSSTLSVESLSYLPRFQELCQKYSYVPTYLLTYEVLSDVNAMTMFRRWMKAGTAEVGTHLHPWTTPPLSEADKDQRFPSELSNEELNQKLSALTEKFFQVFRVMPTCYRAGRWGFDVRQVKKLEELGYLVDSSVTPKVDWSTTLGDPLGIGGPDFRRAKTLPYYVSSENLFKEKQEGLLEVPMTILHTGLIKKEGQLSHCFDLLPKSPLKKILNRLLFKTKWLRIFPETTERDWQAIFDSAEVNRLPVVQFMIHSSELMSGGSPYNKTPQSIEEFYDKFEDMLSFFSQKGVTVTTLSQFAREINNLRENAQ